jgi:hypothetical protein
MRKLTTKLLFAIISAAFALVALGTTTFAWFTLTNEATISPFNAEITAGEGIEISLDGITYYTTIPTEVITAKIAEQNVKLKDLTSEDGINLTKLDGTSVTWTTPTKENDVFTSDPNQFIQFDLWVRSTTPTNVFIDTIDLSATSIDWLADTTFTNAKGITVYPYADSAAAVAAGVTDIPEGSLFGQQPYDASNALRMSFALDGATTANFVYEKPESASNTVLNQTAISNGMVDYYYKKTGINLLKTYDNDGNITGDYTPVIIQSKDLLKDAVDADNQPIKVANPFNLTSLTVKTGNYYVQKMAIRLWVEGWDPDTFNAILNAEIFARIVFTSDPYIEPEI